jgi:hypothetical protein
MLNAGHITDRTAFCTKMLAMREVLRTIHFSDELRVVLGGDRRWIWYRPGEDNPEASSALRKFPRSLMVFGVIGIGFKLNLVAVERTIDTDQYLRNIDRFGFIDALDPHTVPSAVFSSRMALRAICRKLLWTGSRRVWI